jgi:galactonate dehydratase
MKITRFETFLANAGLRNYLFIRLTTDNGLTGVGEASLEWQEKTVETVCHEWVEGRVLGRDPFDVEAVVGAMIRDQYQGGSTVLTAISGVEVAMWDIIGKAWVKPAASLCTGCWVGVLTCDSRRMPMAGMAGRARLGTTQSERVR